MCPPDFTPLFMALQRVKDDVIAAGFSSEELTVLRRAVLFASSGDEGRVRGLEGLGPGRLSVLQRVAAACQGLAIQVSQLSFYKASFSSVLGGCPMEGDRCRMQCVLVLFLL